MTHRTLINRTLRLMSIAAALALAPVATPSLAQINGAATPAPGIGLTPDHKRTIYSEVGQEPARPIPEGSPVVIGAEIPNSMMLNEMPVSVKDKIGVLRDFKFAKLPDETIVIVDPAKRKIVDIVSKSDAAR
jgi:hypothetical protein